MEDFIHQTWLVEGGHMTNSPETIMYASVVFKKTVGIVLMIVALNHLEVKSADILNAYVKTPVTVNHVASLIWQ